MNIRIKERNWLGLAWKASALAAAIVLLVVAFGSRSDYTAEAATFVVMVDSDFFQSNSIAIAAADTVDWQWADGSHNVVPLYSGTWGTEIDDGGNGATPGTTEFPAYFSSASDTYEVSFTNPGPGVSTIWYYCTLHARADDIDENADGVVDGSDTPNFGKMIGRIDVAEVVADSTGPVTSSAAAAPNPTDGAASTTLTATVDDTATGGSNVAAAEYYIDVDPGEGLGTAMAAADASFDSPTENVTASVDVSGLDDDGYTLFVRGVDSAGNWSAADSTSLTVSPPPAGSQDVSLTLTGGSLSLTTNPVAFGVLALSGVDQTVDTTPAAWIATDATGSAAGWNVTVSSTDLTTTGGTITVDNLKLQLLDANIVTVSGNTAPASTVTSYQPLSGAALKILSAAATTGMGTYDFPPDFRLNVPAESAPGVYAAFMTVSINSGP